MLTSDVNGQTTNWRQKGDLGSSVNVGCHGCFSCKFGWMDGDGCGCEKMLSENGFMMHGLNRSIMETINQDMNNLNRRVRDSL